MEDAGQLEEDLRRQPFRVRHLFDKSVGIV